MRRSVLALLLAGIGCASRSAHGARTGRGRGAARRRRDGRGAAARSVRLRRRLHARARDGHRGRRRARCASSPTACSGSGSSRRATACSLQRVPMQKEVFGPGTTIAVEQDGQRSADRDRQGDRSAAQPRRGVPPTKRVAEGELVFVGYGLTQNKPKRDDFAGLNLAGKVVVVVNGAPAGTDSARREQLEAQGAISERLAQILPQRPAAVIILLDGEGDRAVRAVGAAARCGPSRCARMRRRFRRAIARSR